MDQYRTLEPVSFAPGQMLQLSPAQIAARLHGIDIPKGHDRTKAAVVKVVKPVEFKTGEMIGVAGRLSKSLLDKLEPVARPAKSA